jgi:hypothetical protein
MENPKELALQLLEKEKQFLLEDKDGYFAAVAVVVTTEGRCWEELDFDNEQEKHQAYSSVVERAKERGAVAIITVNSSRERTLDSGEELGEYQWGNLKSENCGRALTLSVSGPGIEPCSVSLPFRVEKGEVILGQESGFQPAQIGLLPNWP